MQRLAPGRQHPPTKQQVASLRSRARVSTDHGAGRIGILGRFRGIFTLPHPLSVQFDSHPRYPAGSGACAPRMTRCAHPRLPNRTLTRTLPRVLPGARDISRGKEPVNVRGNVRLTKPQVAGRTFSLSMYTQSRLGPRSALFSTLRAILHRGFGKRPCNVRRDVRMGNGAHDNPFRTPPCQREGFYFNHARKTNLRSSS